MSTSERRQCEAVRVAPDRWECPECGYTSSRRFVRVCGDPAPVRITRQDATIIRDQTQARRLTMEERLHAWASKGTPGYRTEEEALALLDACQACSDFRANHCGRDRGCDKSVVLVLRIMCRWCPEWPAPYDQRPPRE